MAINRSLYLWAKSCEKNKLLLEKWLDEAILKLANQSGQTIVSTSGNGMMVSFASGQTLNDWIETLSETLEMLNNPSTFTRNKSIQVFR